MLYRIVHILHESFALTVFWMYVVALILGLGTIFVFPQAAVVLVFLGLLFLGPAVIGSKLLAALDHAMARQILKRGECPHCGEVSEPRTVSDETWHCPNCQAVYAPTGADVTQLVEHVTAG